MGESKLIATKVAFEVTDKLVIADPCYIDKDDGADFAAMLDTSGGKDPILSRSTGGVVLDGCKGEWIAEAVLEDTGSWGLRVAKLVLERKGYAARGYGEVVGENAVDSGQMGAFPAERLPVDYDALLGEYHKDASGNPTTEFQNHMILAFGGGVVSSTGYGDGVYPVYVQRSGGDEVATVTIDFLGDEEDDE